MSIRVPQLFKYDASIYLSEANFEKEMLKNQWLILPMYQLPMYPQFHKSIEEELDEQDNISEPQELKQYRKRKRNVDIEELDEEDITNELSIPKKLPKQSQLSRKELAEKILKMLDKPIQKDASEDDVAKEEMEDVDDEKKIKKKFKMRKFTDEDVFKITKLTSEQIINMPLDDLKKHLVFKSDAYNFASYYVRRRWTNRKSYEKNKKNK